MGNVTQIPIKILHSEIFFEAQNFHMNWGLRKIKQEYNKVIIECRWGVSARASHALCTG